MTTSRTRRPSASQTSKELWVVPFRKNWALQLNNAEKPFVVVGQDREKAISTARDLAQTREIELVIFNAENVEERRETTTTTLKRPTRTSRTRRPQ